MAVISTRTTDHGVTINTHDCGSESVVNPTGGDFHDKWCFTCKSGWLYEAAHA